MLNGETRWGRFTLWVAYLFARALFPAAKAQQTNATEWYIQFDSRHVTHYTSHTERMAWIRLVCEPQAHSTIFL
jgi:hypothetical protein